MTALSLSLFRLTMSSSFSAHDFDDDTHSVTSTHYQSFIDLSPSSNYHTHTHHSSRTRFGSLGSEDSTTPLHPQRSSIRINTNLMVRICVSNSLFQRPLINRRSGPSLFSPHAENRHCQQHPNPTCGVPQVWHHRTHVTLPSPLQ